MAVTDGDALLDQIYEAAFVPELWPNVLHALGDIATARGTILLTASPYDIQWTASAGLMADAQAYIEGRWHERNTRLPRLLERRHAGFLREIDVFDTPEEIEADSHISEFFRPRGLGWAAGAAIPVPTGDFLVFSIEREFTRGPVEDDAINQLDALRPHLARAGLFAARLGLQRAQAAAQALETVGLPAVVLRGAGRVHAANPSFERLMPDVVQDRSGRLTLTDIAADALLAAALAHLHFGSAADGVRSIPLAAQNGHPPMVVHILPVVRAAHDVFSQASGIVVVTPVDRAAVPTAEVLQGLFDLSPAEARVARGIAEAQTVEALAAAIGVSRETVRSHLKRVLAKTGQGRQAELANLLSGLTLPSSTRPAASRTRK